MYYRKNPDYLCQQVRKEKEVSNMKKIHMCLLLFLLISVFCMGCSASEKEKQGDPYMIYEVNKEETKVVERTIYTTEKNTEELVKLFVDELARISPNADSRPAIPDYLKVNSCIFSEGNVTIDFSNEYSKLSRTGEILSRAAIVRTLTQLDEVNYVTLLVEGNPPLNASGVPIGVMTADQFIDNSGNVINTEEIASLVLYFANKDGDELVKVNREVVYSSNISLEKLVVEQLIKGVQEEENAYSVINPETKVIAVTVRDGVCYVNLDTNFLTQVGNANAEVTIYSITNSLAELSNINKVQFYVNGENEIMYREIMPLSEIYTRNLELVEEIKE